MRTMPNWLDLLTGALGAGIVIVGVLIPATGAYLIPSGVALLALAVKQPSEMLKGSK